MKETEQDNPYMDKDLQKALKKLISEEWFAGNTYLEMAMACKCENCQTAKELFVEIGRDEINDHMAQLIEWCVIHGYEVPVKQSQFRKFASAADVKRYDGFKENKDAVYYIDTAIESEKSALESYKKVIELDRVHEFTDLQALLWHIYYDETEHMEKLNSVKIAYEAGADIIL